MTKYRATVWPEGDIFVAQCLEVDVASQGASEHEAIEALKEALLLHFSSPQSTIAPTLATFEIEIGAA